MGGIRWVNGQEAGSATAQKRYSPGASGTEIKIGNIAPYSGPVSAAGVNGKTIAAYFSKLNPSLGTEPRPYTRFSAAD